ncbi:MAG: hypothetical protein NVS3B16_25970 [Vulcanimicrobiaceae bacterium]
MAPDGVIAMAIWANIPACARTMFHRFDPSFPDRARAAGGGFIVAGHNYGQGSSRESAALVPVELGVRAIAARSFARIHRANLIAQGVVPLVLPDDATVEAGERWRIEGVRDAIASGARTLRVERARGAIAVGLDLTQRERTVLLGGGALAVYRASHEETRA